MNSDQEISGLASEPDWSWFWTHRGTEPAARPVQDGSVLTRDVQARPPGVLSSQGVGPGFNLFNPWSVSVTQMLVLVRPGKEPE